jgi:hypothetical protein
MLSWKRVYVYIFLLLPTDYDISLLEKVQFSNLKAQAFSYNQNVSSTTKTSKIFLIWSFPSLMTVERKFNHCVIKNITKISPTG